MKHIISMGGKGIGKILLDKVIEALKNEGINKATLVVYKDNLIGNEFWQSQDFKIREDLIYRNRSINDSNK